MELTDWRGNPYREGSRVIYVAISGNSAELQEAIVLEIYTTYMDQKSYKWRKLEEGEEVPFQLCWNPEIQEYTPGFDRMKTETRVKLQPMGKGSRNFSIRRNNVVTYVNKNTGEEVDADWISDKYYEPAYVQSFKECGYHTWKVDFRAIQEQIANDGWQRKDNYVPPRPVTLTVLDNITVI